MDKSGSRESPAGGEAPLPIRAPARLPTTAPVGRLRRAIQEISRGGAETRRKFPKFEKYAGVTGRILGERWEDSGRIFGEIQTLPSSSQKIPQLFSLQENFK